MSGGDRYRCRRAVTGDRADVMVWVAAAAPFLLIGLAALISASQHWEMQREVQALAAAAARAGAQPDDIELRSGPYDGEGAQRPVEHGPVWRRVAAVAGQEPGVAVIEVTVDSAQPAAGPPRLDLGPRLGSGPARVARSVTVELRASVDYAFPIPGLSRSVSGRATAAAVESAG